MFNSRDAERRNGWRVHVCCVSRRCLDLETSRRGEKFLRQATLSVAKSPPLALASARGDVLGDNVFAVRVGRSVTRIEMNTALPRSVFAYGVAARWRGSYDKHEDAREIIFSFKRTHNLKQIFKKITYMCRIHSRCLNIYRSSIEKLTSQICAFCNAQSRNTCLKSRTGGGD